MEFRSEDKFVIDRLKNVTRTAEGPNLPPRVRGSSRVPRVSGLRVANRDPFLGGTVFTLVWDEPADVSFVDHYNVFVSGLFEDAAAPTGPYAVPRSPAYLRLTADQATKITFFVQTVLKNGMTLNLDQSPSATSAIDGPDILSTDIDPTVITGLDLVTGRSNLTTANRIVLVDSAGKVKELGSLGTTTTVLHGNAAGAPTFGAVTLTTDVTGVLPIANGGTNNSAAYTAGSVVFSDGTKLTQDNSSLFFDDSANRLGLLNTSPKSTLDVTGSLSVKVVSKVFGDSPYTAGTEIVILVNATGGNVTINLPALSGVAGRVYFIKKTDSSTNTVTVDGDSSETIDGATTYVITAQYECITIVAGSSEWSII